MYLLSLEESDSLDDKFDYDGSDYGCSGTCYFTTFSSVFDESVGHISGLGSGVFIPTRVDSKGNIFVFVVFISIGVKSKCGRLIKMFWRSNYLF